MTAGNDQKTPLAQNLNEWMSRRQKSGFDLQGQNIPASVVSVNENGTIVVIKFEIQDEVLQLPQVECPVATDKYARAPLKEGDMGYVVAADFYMGGASGLGGGIATFDQLPNLSTLVFHPVGNTDLDALTDPDKYEIATPKGAVFKVDTDVVVEIGPTSTGPKNVMRVPTIVDASSDADAAAKGIPLFGLYQTSGAVKVRLT